jgi:hypothetical protein
MPRDSSSTPVTVLWIISYETCCIPIFYENLAKVVRAGYFSHILTTSVDTLLEQALTGVSQGTSLNRQAPYQVITVSPEAEGELFHSPAADDTATIIKLPGDMAASGVLTTPEVINHALSSRRSVTESQVRPYLVMVGYEFEESYSVSNWLAKTPGEELWWVNPDLPHQQKMDPIEEVWRVRYIHGPRAEPSAFFNKLEMRLLSVEELRKDDPSDEEDLLNKIKLCKDALQSLTRRRASGEKNPKITRQIAYQEHKLRELERRHRNLESNRTQIPELLDNITTSAEQAEIDPDILSALQEPADQIKNEYKKHDPNDAIIAAFIGATVDLAAYLGPEVFDSQAVRKLASFAPSRRI